MGCEFGVYSLEFRALRKCSIEFVSSSEYLVHKTYNISNNTEV